MPTLLLLSAATWAAAPGAPGVSVPLHALASPCQDARYPALAGPWAVGCGKTGEVDRAISLHSGERIALPPSISPGLGPGVVYAPEVGRIDLSAPAAAKVSRFERNRLSNRTAPPAVSSAGIAVIKDNSVHSLVLGEKVIRSLTSDAPPLGYQPPAISGQQVAWVVHTPSEGTDIWVAPLGGGKAEPLAGGPGNQHHVQGESGWLAWIEPQGVVILNTQTGDKQTHPAATGFSAGLTLYNGVACWETRTGDDVDIECSDGVQVQQPGHQQYPSRWDRWLLYRDAGVPTLRVLATP